MSVSSTRPEPSKSLEFPEAGAVLLLAIAAGVILAPINSTMIAVGLPRILERFGVDSLWGGWLVSGYLIAQTALQPIGGRLGDTFGRRKLFQVGLVSFGLASLLASVSPSFPFLVLARVLQAMCGALLVPNAFGILRHAVPESRRGRVFGILGAGAAISAAAGPALGGLLVDRFDWHGIFWVNLPLVAIAVGLTQRGMASYKEAPSAGSPPDLASSLAMLAALTTAILVLGDYRRTPAVSAWAPALAAVGLLALLVFIVQERRARDPVVRFSLFRQPGFSAGTGCIFLQNLVLYGVLLVVPLLAQASQGASATASGLALTTFAGVAAFLGPVGGWLADRLGRRLPIVVGALVLVAGIAGLWFLPGTWEAAQRHLVVFLGLIGIGMGMAGAAVQTAAMDASPVEQAGQAAGLMSMIRYLGGILGSTLVTNLVSIGPGLPQSSLTQGFHILLIVLLGAGALTAVLAWWIPPYSSRAVRIAG